MAKQTKKAATNKKVAANKAPEEAVAKKAAEELKEVQANNQKKEVFKHTNGFSYRFKKTAPKTLNIDGVPRSTKHLIEDKAVMLELISGNNSFVERIN